MKATSAKFILIPGVIIIALIIHVYVMTVGGENPDKEFIPSMVRTSNDIARAYSGLNTLTRGDNAQKKIIQFLKKVNIKYQNIALILITDEKYSVRLGSKNDRFITSEGLYNSIVNDFSKGRYRISDIRINTYSYFTATYAAGDNSLKLYMFFKNLGNQKLLIAYVYTPDITGTIVSELRLLLIILSAIMALTYVYIYLQKKKFRMGGPMPGDIDADSNESSIKDEMAAKNGSALNVASDALQTSIYRFFNKLNARYMTDAVSLFIVKATDTLAKNYELKGKSFIKIDSSSFETMMIDNEVGDELKKSMVIVTDQGRRILIPLIHDGSLIGVIQLSRGQSFDGSEIKRLRGDVAGITAQIRDYLMVGSVIVDSATELYSKTFFKIKYNELLTLAQNSGRTFTVMLVALSKSLDDLTPESAHGAIKVVSPSIAQHVQYENYICIYDEFIGILLPDVDKNKAVILAGSLADVLKKFRIKIDRENSLVVTPFFGIASTDVIANKEEMLNYAIKNLEFALSRGTEQILAI